MYCMYKFVRWQWSGSLVQSSHFSYPRRMYSTIACLISLTCLQVFIIFIVLLAVETSRVQSSRYSKIQSHLDAGKRSIITGGNTPSTWYNKYHSNYEQSVTVGACDVLVCIYSLIFTLFSNNVSEHTSASSSISFADLFTNCKNPTRFVHNLFYCTIYDRIRRLNNLHRRAMHAKWITKYTNRYHNII